MKWRPSAGICAAAMVAIVMIGAAGCRNQCGPCLPRPFAMSPRIPAPATNSWRVAQQATQHGAFATPGTTMPGASWGQQGVAGANPAGSSQVVSQPFHTTAVDPRMDTSRLAVSDASQVAAPAALGINPHAGPLAQALYRGQVPPGTNATNIRRGTFEYLAPGRVNPGNTYFAAGPPQQIGQRQVLAQATTLPNEQNPNYQNGWRPPGQTGNPQSINR